MFLLVFAFGHDMCPRIQPLTISSSLGKSTAENSCKIRDDAHHHCRCRAWSFFDTSKNLTFQCGFDCFCRFHGGDVVCRNAHEIPTFWLVGCSATTAVNDDWDHVNRDDSRRESEAACGPEIVVLQA